MKRALVFLAITFGITCPNPQGAYDELRRELDRRNLVPLGDVFEIELSLYSGDWTETVYTEVSVRVG